MQCFRDKAVEPEPVTLQCTNPDCPWQNKKQNSKVLIATLIINSEFTVHMKYAFALRLQAGCGERLRRTHDDSRLR